MEDRISSAPRNVAGYDPVSTAGDCYFDEKAARRAVDFFHYYLVHVTGKQYAGKPFTLSPWQEDIIRTLFGWMRPNGTRRYREALIYVPRKNGKTTLCAGICLYALFCDGEAGAEIYSAAADVQQAAIVFKAAMQMVLRDPELSSRAKVYPGYKSIQLRSDDSSFKAITSDAKTKHGYNAHVYILDELHVQNDRELVDVLETSQGSRMQPLAIYITTADYDRPSICNEKHKYASDVRDGTIEDPYFLPAIFEATIEDDWKDPEVWKKANPNYGISVLPEYLEEKCQRAQDIATYENTFKRLHLNIKTQTAMKWLRLEKWRELDDEEEPDLAGQECYAGLDLASTTDIAAYALAFDSGDGGFHTKYRFFVPEENAEERQKRDRVPYMTWAEQGLITLTPGNVIDYEFIEQSIYADAEVYQLLELAYDPFQATDLVNRLDKNGIQVAKLPQNFGKLNAPSKELERLVLAKLIHHYGNPVIRWMVGNVMVVQDAMNNIRPDKKRSSEKIDGVTALLMAIAIARASTPEAPSVYETRGVRTF